MTNHVNCEDLPAVGVYADGNRKLCQSAWHLKEGVWCTLEELHISMKVIQTQKLIGRLRWLHISNFEKSEHFVSFSPNNIQIFYINRRLPNVSGWQCDSYKVWQLHSVTAAQCDSYTVWQLHSVRAIECDSYTVWQLHSVTAIQCDCYTVWQLHSVTAIQCDCYAVWQLHSVTATQCDCRTVCVLYSATATQCDS
jgi:hypothetical protein